VIASLTGAFSSHNEAAELWEEEPGGEGLLFSPRLWPLLRGKVDLVSACYHETALTPALTSTATENRLTLPSGRRLAVARQQVFEALPVTPDVVEAILSGDEKGIPREILDFERIPSGLAEYF
jgi:hypothetical protein